MKEILQKLIAHKTLTIQEATETMLRIGNGQCNEVQITAFITTYLLRQITIDELIGFKNALLQMCLPINLGNTISTDIVGTGGDGKNTFNISTLSCIIVAGAGHKVVKHGNYGITAVSGSSNVLEQLGYTFTNNPSKLLTQLDKTNICFLHAPLFHPALKNVANVRRNLGLKSIFNLLGPLVNPAQPSHQIIGVYNLEVARYYQYVLQQSNSTYCIINTLDGYDEISLTTDTKVINNQGEQIYSPEYLGKRTVTPSHLYGGNTVAEAAQLFIQIINGNGTWAQNAVVLANAAIAIQNLLPNLSYAAAFEQAVQSLESGAAKNILNTLINTK